LIDERRQGVDGQDHMIGMWFEVEAPRRAAQHRDGDRPGAARGFEIMRRIAHERDLPFGNGEMIGEGVHHAGAGLAAPAGIEAGDEVDTYIEYLLDDARRADTFDVDWTKHGFRKLNDDAFESGFHPGQTDNPAKILKAAQAEHPDHEFLFSIDSTGQFDINFSLWARPIGNE